MNELAQAFNSIPGNRFNYTGMIDVGAEDSTQQPDPVEKEHVGRRLLALVRGFSGRVDVVSTPTRITCGDDIRAALEGQFGRLEGGRLCINDIVVALDRRVVSFSDEKKLGWKSADAELDLRAFLSNLLTRIMSNDEERMVASFLATGKIGKEVARQMAVDYKATARAAQPLVERIGDYKASAARRFSLGLVAESA